MHHIFMLYDYISENFVRYSFIHISTRLTEQLNTGIRNKVLVILMWNFYMIVNYIGTNKANSNASSDVINLPLVT